MFSSARNILPALIMVCILSFLIRGLEVWSGMKSLSGVAFAVEQNQEMSEKPTETAAHEEEMKKSEEMVPAPDRNKLEIAEETTEDSKKEEAAMEEDFSDYDISPIQAELAEDLVKQRKRLEERENILLQKEALLKAAEQELDHKYQELVALRKDIEDLLGKQSEEEDARIKSLVQIYENMKAKEAADIFNTLDIDILVSVISKMSERKVSPILAAMNTERARAVTILLAEQKQLPKLPDQ
jgi:flagellar motility protein MotE (MotC chaperone)